ncbi:Major Facilitator Superfamily protein [Actinopolymorpha singaporensis]|uniref:Major Facilitator Superfamily protein n=2 Tax=Actinopolymorpha singaporensis TaxID=117157 RepID=A0A1H1PNR5_9ACTN|nr:Major Facilitator Superfamily protein [Actinopolymorpha singaporensis]
MPTMPNMPDRSGHRPTLTLLAACVSTLLVLMNYTQPMTVLPQMATDLHAGPSGQTWILNGIALGLASLLLVAGSLADNHGRRLMFLLGTAVSLVGSVMAATAGTTLVMVLARVVQGGAGAAILVATLGIIGHEFPAGHNRVRATGMWGASLGAGIALGPLASAGLAAAASWRAFFWAYALASAALGLLGALTLRESRAAVRRRPDVPAVVTLGAGVAVLLAAVTAGRQGFGRPLVLALFAGAVLLLGAFVAVEARTREPMLDLGLFTRPAFLLSVGGALITGFGVIGVMSYLPTAWEHTLGWTPLATACWFALWSGTSFAAATQARRAGLGADHQLALGFALAGAGSLLLLGSAGSWSPTRTVAGLVVAGMGSGLLNSALARLAIESVPAGRASMGSGANNTARYIGSSLGVAATVAVVTTAGAGHGTGAGTGHVAGPGAALGTAHGVDVALVAAAALLLVTAALVLARSRAAPAAPPRTHASDSLADGEGAIVDRSATPVGGQ